MKYANAKSFKAEVAWGSDLLAAFSDVDIKVHWPDMPYRWHANTGRELFLVIDGKVDMHYRQDGAEKVQTLEAGDVMVFEEGEEHVAHPVGEARIVVAERRDSE